MSSPERPSPLAMPLAVQPATWQEICAFLRKQDEWMRAMSEWAAATQNWFITHDQGGNTTPPQPPPKPWP